VERCPDDRRVDEVLDGSASLEAQRVVRSHVATCARCLARHGAAFELELLGAELPVARDVAPSTVRASRRVERRPLVPLAIAAGLLALAGGASWLLRARSTPDEGTTRPLVSRPTAPVVSAPAAAPHDGRESRPALRVLELVTSVETRGPTGTTVITTTRRENAPPRIVEQRTDRSGTTFRHERSLPPVAFGVE
jgi:hypothetical protein